MMQVFVDTVDMDNLLVCLSLAKHYRNRFFQIILAKRAVDFKAKPYGENFTSLVEQLGLEKMLVPLKEKPKWAESLPEDMQPYFERDASFQNEDGQYLREDLPLYMQLSAFRFASLLVSHGVDADRFTFYMAEDSKDRVVPGIRHAAHVPDYSYDFNKAEKEDYNRALEEPMGDQRREKVLAVCRAYINRQTKRFGLTQSSDILGDFSKLMESSKRANLGPTSIMIGGPFTEAVKWIEYKLPVKSITAMAFYINGRSNIFKNQYNVLLDIDSAVKFLDAVQNASIATLLVPTECIKNSPWQLDREDLEEVFKDAPELYEMVKTFTKDTNTLSDVILFDWVAGIIQRYPDLLPTRPVEWYEKNIDGERVIEIRDSQRSCISMCKADHKIMHEKKGVLINAMKADVAH